MQVCDDHSPRPTQCQAKDRTEQPKQEAAEVAYHWIREVLVVSASAKPNPVTHHRYLLHERISGVRARQDRLGILSSVEGKTSGPVALLGPAGVIWA